jgi:hypothetical protein
MRSSRPASRIERRQVERHDRPAAGRETVDQAMPDLATRAGDEDDGFAHANRFYPRTHAEDAESGPFRGLRVFGGLPGGASRTSATGIASLI